MMQRMRVKRLLILGLILGALQALAADKARELEWDDLMPPNWDPLVQLKKFFSEENQALDDTSPQAAKIMSDYLNAGANAPIVPALNGTQVKLPGFVVPLDFEEQELKEFLLVPYFGACIHVPPPPANQVVYVKTSKPYRLGEMSDAVWVVGKLSTEAFANDVGNAGYTLQATSIEAYKE